MLHRGQGLSSPLGRLLWAQPHSSHQRSHCPVFVGAAVRRADPSYLGPPKCDLFTLPQQDFGPSTHHPVGRAGSTHGPHSTRGDSTGAPGPDPGDKQCPGGVPGMAASPGHPAAQRGCRPPRTPWPAADSAINHGDTSSGQDGGDDRDHPSACHPC